MPKDTKTLCIKKGCASVLTQPLPRQETRISNRGNDEVKVACEKVGVCL